MTENADNRFPRTARLLSPKDFSRVFDGVQYRAGSRHFLILATPSETPRARIGLIIAKRHVKRAVQRNRIKRLIRESFRHRQVQLPALDIVILARPGLGQQDNGAIFQALDRLWHKLEKNASQSQVEHS